MGLEMGVCGTGSREGTREPAKMALRPAGGAGCRLARWKGGGVYGGTLDGTGVCTEVGERREDWEMATKGGHLLKVN